MIRRFKNIWNPRLHKDGGFLLEISRITGFKPSNAEIYFEAFTHSSLKGQEETKNIVHTERLEFLGDAILTAIVSDFLYHAFPDKDEGVLTQTRAKIVSRKNLNQIGQEMKLLPLVKRNLPVEHFSESIVGNALEALIGALYLDLGYKSTKQFVLQKIIKPYIAIEQIGDVIISYRSVINEWSQKNRKRVEFDVYELPNDGGNPHFKSELKVDGVTEAIGEAVSKKLAKEIAAENWLKAKELIS
jgi:ribonuclease-3